MFHIAKSKKFRKKSRLYFLMGHFFVAILYCAKTDVVSSRYGISSSVLKCKKDGLVVEHSTVNQSGVGSNPGQHFVTTILRFAPHK